ncbi:MAG: XdhC family protein, partial [Pyrinomonadaceae bacterium]|nr:XdhC family protein [Pyrinomonadaceae bacterium]
GSSYRLPGARMLIKASGETFGTVSGGCLEADVLERAKNVIKTSQAIVITYDTSAKDDDVFSLNLGCNGLVRILLEKVEAENFFSTLIEQIYNKREKAVIATLIKSNLTTKVGERLTLSCNGKFQSDFDGKTFQKNLLIDCQNAFKAERSFIKTYKTEESELEFLIEIIKPPIDLTIFGAGHDAIPLANFAKNLGWQVSIVDHRAAFANRERFANVDKITLTRPENFDFSTLDETSVAVVMTHDYEKDKFILSKLLKLKISYVGALGPKRRTEDILKELKEAGQSYSTEQLQKLYAPIGLDIGAETPNSIAISIIAEINSVLSNREGGFLRKRQNPIYERTEHVK